MVRTFDVGPRNYTPQWYGARVLDEEANPPLVCGASEAGVICGVSKYKTALELYLEKRSLKPTKESTENMDWGHNLEPAILDEYSKRMSVKVTRPGHLLTHRENPFIGASPDGMCNIKGADLCVDAKITTFRMYDSDNARKRDCFGDGEDEIPSDYLMQAHQQMYVTGTERCDFPVLFDGNRLRIYTIKRDEMIVEHIVRNVTDFVARVANSDAPEPDWNHEKTIGMVKDMFGVVAGQEIVLSDEGIDAYHEWCEAKIIIGEKTREKESAMAKILFEMGDAAAAIMPGESKFLSRVEIEERIWMQGDVADAQQKVGEVKRKGYIRITERKLK